MAAAARILVTLAAVVALAAAARADVESDRKECGEALMKLATCLSYVGGTSNAPTPDCCAGLREMVQASPKCLCLLIKDHDNPAVDLKMDPVRAMSLPSECNTPGNISYCPKLLHLPPDSPDAKIFEDFKNRSRGNGTESYSKGDLTATNYSGRSKFIGEGERWRWISSLDITIFSMLASLLLLTTISI